MSQQGTRVDGRLYDWAALEGPALAGAREDGSVLSIGIFDGLHRGHQRILAAAERIASAAGLHRVHIGFDPHPDALLRGEAPLRLLDAQEFELRLAAAGVEHWCDLPFDATMRDTEWQPFLSRIVAATSARSIVLSPESALGRGREGSIERIRTWAAARGIQVHPVAEVQIDGVPVRSTAIREAIMRGDLPGAARALGRPHAIIARRSPNALDLQVEGEGFAIPPDGEYEMRIGAAAHRAGRLPLTGRVVHGYYDRRGGVLSLEAHAAERLPTGATRLRAALLRRLAGRRER